MSRTWLGGASWGMESVVLDSWGGVVSAAVVSVVLGISATGYLEHTDCGHVVPMETPLLPGV